jgi:ligand-binding SRPBCC domain-containing protein
MAGVNQTSFNEILETYMREYTFTTEQWIAAPLDDVFAFFSDVENLLRIEPEALRVRVEAKDLVPPVDIPERFLSRAPAFLGAGSEVVISYCLPFFPLWRRRHRARITEYSWGSHFADEHDSWLMSWRHRHEFAALVRDGVEGTVVRDIVHYRLWPDLPGRIAHLLFAQQLVHDAFRYRHRAIEQIVNAGALLAHGFVPAVRTV